MNDELMKGEGMLVPQRIPNAVNGVGLQQFNIYQNKGNNKITEHRAILQRESQNS